MTDMKTALAASGFIVSRLAGFVREFPRFRLRDFPVPPGTPTYVLPSHEPLWVRGNGLGDIAVMTFDFRTGDVKLTRTGPADDGRMPEDIVSANGSTPVAVIERHDDGFIVRIRL